MGALSESIRKITLQKLGERVWRQKITKSAELLIEEYHLIKRTLETGDVKDATTIEVRQKAASDLLLKKRDEFIAARIATTLQAGETGILFLGMLHHIAGLLPGDIDVLYPMNLSSVASPEVVIPSKSPSSTRSRRESGEHKND